MQYEPTTYELAELEFTHKVSEAAECCYEGIAMNAMADLMVQRFQHAELMLYTNHVASVNYNGKKEAKEIFSKLARDHVDMHVSIGMLNHNTELLERMIKAYPDQFNIVWSLYVTTFMKIFPLDSVYLKKEFFKYKIDIEWAV